MYWLRRGELKSRTGRVPLFRVGSCWKGLCVSGGRAISVHGCSPLHSLEPRVNGGLWHYEDDRGSTTRIEQGDCRLLTRADVVVNKLWMKVVG